MGGAFARNRGLKLVTLRQTNPKPQEAGGNFVNGQNEIIESGYVNDEPIDGDAQQNNREDQQDETDHARKEPRYMSEDGMDENPYFKETKEDSFDDPADFVVDGLLKYDFESLKRRTATAEEELATLADCIEDDVKKVIKKVMIVEGPRPNDYRTPYNDIRQKYVFFKDCAIEIINMPVNKDDPIIHKPVNSQDQVTVIQSIADDESDR